jgi:hypothetical protein
VQQHPAQQVRHHERRVGADDVARLRPVLLEQVAVTILHRQHPERLHPDALIRERRVRAGDLEQRRVARPQRNRQVRREVLLEAEPLGVGEDGLRPERVHHLDRGDVARLFERPPQGDRAFELVIVIVRAVDGAVAGRIADRRVDEDRGRREAAVDRRRVDDRLERGSELAVGLHGAVELAAVEVPAADHRLDLSGPVLDREECALDDRRLIERHRRRAGGFVELRDGDLDEIAGLEQIRGRRARVQT